MTTNSRCLGVLLSRSILAWARIGSLGCGLETQQSNLTDTVNKATICSASSIEMHFWRWRSALEWWRTLRCMCSSINNATARLYPWFAALSICQPCSTHRSLCATTAPSRSSGYGARLVDWNMSKHGASSTRLTTVDYCLIGRQMYVW